MIEEVDFTINDTERFKKTIAGLSVKIRDLENEKSVMKEKTDGEIKKLRNQLSMVNKNSYISSATERSKQIIKLFAFGFSIGNIYKMMTEQVGVECDINEIESIVNNIDLCHEELQRYYVEMKKLFEEKNSLTKGFFASSLYKKLMLLENEVSLSLVNAKALGDENLKLKCVENLLKVYEKSATLFSKSGLDIFNKTMSLNINNEYDKQNEDVFKKNKGETFEISIDDIMIN